MWLGGIAPCGWSGVGAIAGPPSRPPPVLLEAVIGSTHFSRSPELKASSGIEARVTLSFLS